MEYARELLNELHPIEDTPICVAFPWLGAFTFCGIPNYPKSKSEKAAKEQ